MTQRHDRATDETRERALSWVLGTLDAQDAAAFREHLDAPCASCRDEVQTFEALAADLAMSVTPSAPPPGLKERILRAVTAAPKSDTQVWRRWSAPVGPPSTDHLVVLAGQGDWQATAIDGIEVRRLAVDPARDVVTMMVRMRPGTSYPPHRHAGVEECYVLAGDLRHAEQVLRAGDYERLERGSLHGRQWTQDGCLLLIHSSRNDELFVI